MTQPWSSGNAWSPRDQFCLNRNIFSYYCHLHDVKLFIVKKTQSLDEIWKNHSTIHASKSHELHCMDFSLVNFHLMSATIFREITSHYGDDHSIKKYLAGVKTDLWGFIRFLEITSRYDKHNFLFESKWMSWHFICLTSQSHLTRMISIIKWHLTIKHSEEISSEPHSLHYKFATDASILHIFEGYWAKNTSWMEVLARDMPSGRVKIIFDMLRGLREGDSFNLRNPHLQEQN